MKKSAPKKSAPILTPDTKPPNSEFLLTWDLVSEDGYTYSRSLTMPIQRGVIASHVLEALILAYGEGRARCMYVEGVATGMMVTLRPVTPEEMRRIARKGV